MDILEYQSHVLGVEAANYHFKDIVESNDAGEEFEISFTEPIPHANVCLAESSEAWFLSGRQMVAKFKEDPTAKNLIDVHMVLYRLPQFDTDIVMVMNSPVAISKESSSSTSLSPNSPQTWTLEMFKQIACTLTMHNSGIFGEDT